MHTLYNVHMYCISNRYRPVDASKVAYKLCMIIHNERIHFLIGVQVKKHHTYNGARQMNMEKNGEILYHAFEIHKLQNITERSFVVVVAVDEIIFPTSKTYLSFKIEKKKFYAF